VFEAIPGVVPEENPPPNHHTMVHCIRRTDHLFKVLNLFLLCVAVLPFTTARPAKYARGTEAERRLAALRARLVAPRTDPLEGARSC
jgi:hypothetical protein